MLFPSEMKEDTELEEIRRFGSLCSLLDGEFHLPEGELDDGGGNSPMVEAESVCVLW